jgi:glycosyltransferase involved in cell wall biosynthesis
MAREDPRDAGPMRILHIGKYYPPVPGGMERFLGDLAQTQRSAGHEVAVLVNAHKRSRGVQDPAWIRRVPVWMRLVFAPISPVFPFWLHRAIRDFKPDVLHLHMPNLSAFWALMLPSALRIPWVVHWQSDVEQSKLALRLAYPAYRAFEYALLERAEAIVVTSPQYLEASHPLEPWKQKCQVVPLGVDTGRLPRMRGVQSDDLWTGRGLRVLAVGRLTYYKGFETLIQAMLGDDSKQLVIVGEGEERRKLERLLAHANDPGSIRLIGEADEETLHRLMASCDVFCLPSRERTEAFGIVLIEAMRYSKPLVVSNLRGSGVTWVARDGQNAVLVPPADITALRSALDALAGSPARRMLLGHLGYQRYLREFGIADVARHIDGVYLLALRAHAQDVIAPIELDPEDAAITMETSGRFQASDGTGRLLVVIPALNEAECIASVVEQVRAHRGVDVLVIDDGSSDDTAAVAMVSGAGVLRAPLWQGAWGAIQTGIRYALRHGYSGVVTMDADGQHEPAYLPELIAAAREADVVIASCPSRGSRMRQIAWGYFRLLTGFHLDDLTSGFRYYNERACRLLAAEEATLLDYQDIGVLLLLHHARLRIAEISVAMNPRKHGASRVFSSWWTVARYMAETSLLCLARWNQPARKRLRKVELVR